jgi:hypothetical protein
MRWKPTPPCKLWTLQSEPHDVDPKEGSWEVGGVICISAFANHPSHLSWVLYITPPTFHNSSLGSTSCGSDWSFHSLHGGIDLHLICSQQGLHSTITDPYIALATGMHACSEPKEGKVASLEGRALPESMMCHWLTRSLSKPYGHC